MSRLLGLLAFLFLVSSLPAHAALLPGFRVELVGQASKFVTSIDIDSRGNILYSTADGRLLRMAPDGTSVLLATLPTEFEGNAGLLGAALVTDDTAVVHYTTPGRGFHVISRVDLGTGAETVLATMSSDPEVMGREVSTEHHGGNLTLAPDGSIFFGIGDFGGFLPASLPQWIAGKIWRLTPQGELQQWALGLRNPYDLAWDPELQKVVLTDNGPEGGDEVNVTGPGGDLGWPFAMGTQPAFEGDVAPSYVFPETVAPTGMVRLSGAGDTLRRGYLIAGFVTKAIYYFPDLSRAPLILMSGFEGGPVIDVNEGDDGTIYFTTPSSIYRLRTPLRGDCNGDFALNYNDVLSLQLELAEGTSVLSAGEGAHVGTFGCDVNADGVISTRDVSELARLVTGRRRSLRR